MDPARADDAYTEVRFSVRASAKLLGGSPARHLCCLCASGLYLGAMLIRKLPTDCCFFTCSKEACTTQRSYDIEPLSIGTPAHKLECAVKLFMSCASLVEYSNLGTVPQCHCISSAAHDHAGSTFYWQ